MSTWKTINKTKKKSQSQLGKRRKRGVVLTLTGLEKLQEAQLKLECENNWGAKYTYEKLSEIGDLDINTVKKILAAKEGVDRRSLENYFRAFEIVLIEEDYAKPNPNKRQDWGEAISVSDFSGRTSELNTLENLLFKNKCRLITILAMGGVGKTTLSIKLAQKVGNRFDCLIWRSFRDAPPLNEFLAESIQFLSDGQLTETELPERTSQRISYLINYFRSLRCLIVLDNVESLLCGNGKAGFYREGYEEYGEFFRRVGATDHQSCLILTTREKPKEVAMLEGEALPVCTFKLGGLKPKAGAKMLIKKGLNGSEVEFNELVRHYDGNSLALKIVSTTIRDLFDGNIKNFLRQETSVFGDIRNLISQQFERLSPMEVEIVYWLAISREPLNLSQLRENLVSVVPRLDLLEGLESLSRRSLIEQNEACFTLQPVVMEYTILRLIETIFDEICTQKLHFLHRYALIEATAKEYVRETQIRLILQPAIEKLLTIFKGQKSLELQLTRILETQRETSLKEPGYTSGNIINLLCKLGIDLRTYDLSDLVVWQADLRQACLHNVNFQNTSIVKSLFAEAFGGIWSVVFSPDGQYLATGDTKGEILVRRSADGQIVLSLKGHNGWVVSLAFSPDGKTLASGSCDCTIKLWNIDTGKCLHTLQEYRQEVWSVVFSPDGKTLASGGDDNKLKLWDASSGECLQVFQGHSNELLSVAFSLDGRELISGSQDRVIKLWDIETGECKKTFQEHRDGVRSISLSPDGQTIASGSNDGTIRLWDIATGSCIRVGFGHTNVVLCVRFCLQGNLLASSSIDHTVRLWDINTGECLKVFQGHSNMVNSIAFSSQGNYLASGSYDQTVKIWNVNTGKCCKIFQGYSNQALSVTFSADGKMLASGGRDRQVRLWDIGTKREIKTLHGHTNWVYSLAFGKYGNFLASSSGDKSIKLWNVETGKTVKTFWGHEAVVRSIAFSSDGQTIASGSEDRTIRLWNISRNKAIQILRGHQAEVWSIAFSSDGRILASSSFDGTAKLWNVETGKCYKTFDKHTSWIWSVAFSPDDKILATTSVDRTIRLWSVDTGECQQILREETGHSEIAFSSDGGTLASCSQDHGIRLWSVSTGKCYKTLAGHTALIDSIAFSSDCRTLASSSEDETIKLWNYQSGECIQTLRVEKPYQWMNISGISGLSPANIDTLKALGAVDG